MLVLVLEDDAALRRAMTEALRRDGHDVRQTDDDLLALGWLADGWLPEVAVVDLLMPKTTGETFLWTVRNRPQLAAVRIVLASGVRDLDVIAEREGAVEVLRKPFGLDELLDTVRRAGAAQ